MSARQGPGGIRVTSTSAVLGGAIEVDVATCDTTVSVSGGGAAPLVVVSVPPGKHLSIPVPQVPVGTFLSIAVGRGLNRHVVLIEVVATPP